jgi:dUTP pyrophosphatase
MEILFKQLTPDAVIPTHGSEEAAGYDLYAASIKNEEGVRIHPGEVTRIGTGLAMAIPKGYAGLILPRSGVSTKRGLRPANSPGLVDSDYRGEVTIFLRNDSNQTQAVMNGERIAQLLIVPYLSVDWTKVDELSDTKRGCGGFGSTGTR